jgi:predicted DNA-binding antitoxin AbrB/MazE fold protein
MTITVEAVFEHGVLKPVQPLPLKEQERVRLTLHTAADIQAAAERVRATAGLIPCSDAALIDRIALDPIEDL